MSRKPSSILWLNNKYSRAKGEIARTTARLKDLESRLKFHRHHAQRCETKLIDLRAWLKENQSLAEQLARAMKLHSHATPVDEVFQIRPHEHPAFFKRGGMTRAIFQVLKSAPNGVVTIDELQAHIVEALGTLPDDIPRLRLRLQIRLQTLLREGKVVTLDRNWVPGRRWMLSKEWDPTLPRTQGKHRERHRSQGSSQPARWLIQSQLEIASALNGDVAAQSAGLASGLNENLSAVSAVWMLHPLHFEVDLEKGSRPQRTAYRDKVYACVTDILVRSSHWVTVMELQSECSCLSNSKRRVSIRAVEAALRQLLLEGRVEHRGREADGQVEWRLRSSAGESINTSVR